MLKKKKKKTEFFEIRGIIGQKLKPSKDQQQTILGI
jgi:hypothetical protein